MGEDLFWALRGGGGASFGVIVSWKIKLVSVPPVVTVFSVWRKLEHGALSLFFKWQTLAHKLPKDLTIRTVVQSAGGRTIEVQFQSLFLGKTNELLSIMSTSFPELGLEAKDCAEMGWINSIIDIGGLDGSIDILLDRSAQTKKYFKGKSDFITQPISPTQLESIWKVMLEDDKSPMMICEPFGGRMNEISESEIAFPHRGGNLYNIQYFVDWKEEEGGISASTKYLESSRKLYNYMTPYVSKSPRASYLNYKDLDLGVNDDVSTSYLETSAWGSKYFKNNFERLMSVKSKVDPENFFWNEQSIPPLASPMASSGKRVNRPFILTQVKSIFVE
ncbi:cinnamyl-alcohol dehydrogenase [Ranunculus cassubicifolius]